MFRVLGIETLPPTHTHVGKIPKYFRNFFWNAMPSVSKLLFPGQQCCEHYGPGGQSAGGHVQRTVGPCHREGVSVSGVRDLPENFSFGPVDWDWSMGV